MELEVLNAARLIKDYCFSHGGCNDCPLFNASDTIPMCRIAHDQPHMWDVGYRKDLRTCKDAIKAYGMQNQIDMMIEEMSELTKALIKYRRGYTTDVVEEMADVSIMLDQMKMIFGSYEEVRAQKIERLEKRIRELSDDRDDREKKISEVNA